MTDEKWQKVKDIFDVASQLKPALRQEYIEYACGDDAELFSEVESLVVNADNSGFMKDAAVGEVVDVIVGESKTKTATKGQQISHYKILSEIGKGGMGEVYLAEDMSLDRQVALKILPKEFAEDKDRMSRFVREAKSASALNHPNIITIYEINEFEGTHFIATEFIDGNTLNEYAKSDSLDHKSALEIAIQVASALDEAHSAGIVHRDIKPDNIMIRLNGLVKILDFGIAKLTEQQNPEIDLEDDTAIQINTTPGMIIGTPDYMSPEQARGKEVDARTDIFSFGVVLYEMIAGRTPFAGDSVLETFANLINSEPPLLARFAENVPDELNRIVAKTLRKKRDERYQAMKDLLTDLTDLRENLLFDELLEKLHLSDSENKTQKFQAATNGTKLQIAEIYRNFARQIKRHKPLAAIMTAVLLVGAIALGYYFYSAKKTISVAEGKKSIVVLPVQPIDTANRDNIYEVGIAHSLILKLSSMKGFVVRPLSAIRKYADIEQDPIAAGKEQQVDYVLASNYQLSGGKIRIITQLFNVASGQIEETYKIEKDAGDIFAMQDAIADEVSNSLLARFATTSSSPTAKLGTTNKEAYRLYLQGLYLYDSRNLANVRKAVEFMEQAVRLDPNYALAWAGLAHTRGALAVVGPGADLDENAQKVIEAVKTALTLDPNLSEAHSILCGMKTFYENDYAGAERACRRAVELNPDSPLAHNIYAQYLLGRGRFDKAIAEIQSAIDLEPTSSYNQNVLGSFLYYTRRYDEAAAQFKKIIEMDENIGGAYTFLSRTLALQGKETEAFQWEMKGLALQKSNEETVRAYQAVFQKSGWQGFLRERARRFNASDENYYVGALYNAEIGNKSKALDLLEKSYQGHDGARLANMQWEPRFNALHDNPRFQELLRKISLPREFD